ncbi:MAG: hypothetical protein Q7T07_19845 [Burkholderiaceae bacterium]|nr:hypothetical protein [Burkholderiaceae bacterium]
MTTTEIYGEVTSLGDGFWSRDRKKAGLLVDVLRGQNIPGNAKTIDRTLVPDGIVSHKSTDLRCKSYQSPRAVYRLGMAFARSVAQYQGEVRRNHKIKATYFLEWAVQRSDAPRILEWFDGFTAGSQALIFTAHAMAIVRNGRFVTAFPVIAPELAVAWEAVQDTPPTEAS